MKKITLMFFALVLVGVAVSGQIFQMSDGVRSWQIENPFIFQRPDTDSYAVFISYTASHDFPLTEITTESLAFLEIYLSDNQLAALWEQINLYGPVKNWSTLEAIKSFSPTSSSMKAQRTFSERVALQLALFIEMPNGQNDYDTWPYAEE